MPGAEGFNGMKGAEVSFLAVVALVIGCCRLSFTPSAQGGLPQNSINFLNYLAAGVVF